MTAVVTLASLARLDHVERQQERLAREDPEVLRVLVWLDPTPAPAHLAARALTLHVPPGGHGLRLAAGRNRGVAAAVAAGHDLVVLLDADCVPGPAMLKRYVEASARHPRSLLCGPVTYLPEGVRVDPATDLAALTAPHPARPDPEPGTTVVAADEDYALFWSLSFATTTAGWEAFGGFDEAYEGYGGEDTDVAFRARAVGVPLVWVGGAHAYHQHHATSAPPWQHLDDILRNGALFARRWGRWPMEGWITAFAQAGAIEQVGDGWRRVPA
ncbi:glycosyltransferase [Serinibacter arcticus]|uniref:Glycosyltransferase n=1 Tax=Serinibacter arcticus TaxID=1655435 RepID=A0A2U1ZSH4_9MICO|nr:glycosyltransferase [Serinibacter arcticus]PWD49935.1 glycosyltransferase [Serinibacter arcticus]